MQRISIVYAAAAILVSGLILGTLSAGEAQAQTEDHLKCYKCRF